MNRKLMSGGYPMGQDEKQWPYATSSLSGGENVEEQRIEVFSDQAMGSQKVHQVVIFSPDRFVRDFLKGILVFLGYECVGASDDQALFSSMTLYPSQVVFLDGLYLLGDDSVSVRYHTQECIRAGIKVMVLADRRWDSEMTRAWEMGGCQIVWKPLDYRQLSVVMAQIGFEPTGMGSQDSPGRWPVQGV
ncbi:MAG: hypothetical protein OEZ57_03450 [Nitrospirota bacterium]|nr:hypothetical protein [Nitrospirota bacterium]MDH5585557.1 hypothetical protein [Nitrospirota bacterium]MDH5773956.1 hypothetical protein [Nitrospirota bacterium]